MDIRIESVFVGRPQSFPSEGDSTPWTSAIVKQRVDGPVYVRTTNIDGDQQADLVHHGGLDKAICAYALQNYACWIPEFPSIDWQAGCFGENLTLSGVNESDVCIGDILKVGSCVLQVSQPRQPCWKLSRHWKLPKLAVRVQQTRRTGWYFRVLNEGLLESGQVMKVIDRTCPRWTIAAANDVMFAKPRNSENDQKLAACPLLSSSWRETLRTRARSSDHIINENEQRRLGNPDP
jgi:MOSC domain-containing protein YiiM